MTPDVVATAHAHRVPLVIVAPATEFLPGVTGQISALVVAASSPLRDPKQLEGKTIAVPSLASFAEYNVRAYVDNNGGDSSTLKFVEIPFPAMSAALEGGRVDAAWVVEPFMGPAARAGRVLQYGGDITRKPFLIAGWVATAQWAQTHPDVVRRFAAAIRTIAIWANTHQNESGAILAQHTQLPPTVIATMTRVRYVETDLATLLPLIQPMIDLSAKYGGFPSFPAQELLFVP